MLSNRELYGITKVRSITLFTNHIGKYQLNLVEDLKGANDELICRKKESFVYNGSLISSSRAGVISKVLQCFKYAEYKDSSKLVRVWGTWQEGRLHDFCKVSVDGKFSFFQEYLEGRKHGKGTYKFVKEITVKGSPQIIGDKDMRVHQAVFCHGKLVKCTVVSVKYSSFLDDLYNLDVVLSRWWLIQVSCKDYDKHLICKIEDYFFKIKSTEKLLVIFQRE